MKKRTELVFIVDRSGSMAGLEEDTIGGYNSVLQKQQSAEGECTITTVLFDHQYELLHDRIPVEAVSMLTEREYDVRGSTALLDAVGKSIEKIDAVQKSLHESYRADHVLFVMITDGYENASCEYSVRQIRKMIEYKTKEFGWEFLFLGANIDAVKTAAHYGIAKSRAQTFHHDATGIKISYEAVGDALLEFRLNEQMPDDWGERIEKDYKSRQKKE